MRIRAAVFEESNSPLVVADLDLEDPRPNEVLVRLAACGVCHTDIKMARDWPADRRPMVFGHEGAGTVEATGSEVEAVAPGDKVVLTFNSCGSCVACRSGKVSYCAQNVLVNFSGTRPDGTTTMTRRGERVYGSFFGQSSFASHVLATERNLVRVPAETDLAIAAPLGCGIQTGAGAVLNVLRPGPEQALVVYGAGGVGDAAVMAAAATGVETIVVVEPVAARRELALQVGATAAIDPHAGDVREKLHELVPGGPTHAFDTTGNEGVMNGALGSLAVNGVLAMVAFNSTELTIDPRLLMGGGRSLRGVIEGDSVPQSFIPQLLDLYHEGRLPLDKLIQSYPHDLVNAAVADANEGRAVKPVLLYEQ